MKHEKNVWPIIIKAVNTLVDFAKPTFGPAGNKIIVSRYNQIGILDDGAAVVRDFEVEDEFENKIIELVKTVAIKTNDRAGDGTTGSLIITQAILNEVGRVGDFDGRKISTELKTASEEAKDQLIKKARKINTKRELEQVAQISFDNPEVAKMIADLVYKTGHDGVVTVQESGTMDITYQIMDGYEFDRGFVSPYSITRPQRMDSEMSNAYILLTDYRLTSAYDVVPIMNKMLAAGKHELVIIAENIEGDALATLVRNRLEGKINVLGIGIPSFADKKEFLSDISVLTGAEIISLEKGNKMEDVSVEMLGRANQVVANADKTVIVGGKGKKSDMKNAIEAIKNELTKEISKGHKERLERRLAKLKNGVAVIKVGAMTKHEMEALKYKVEDAVNAVQLAYKSGIVCGGGLSLYRLKTSSELLNKALKQPAKYLFANSGIEERSANVWDDSEKAYNIVTGKEGKFLEVGVIDPVGVLIAQIESAISIANLLITSKGVLVEQVKKEEVQNA